MDTLTENRRDDEFAAAEIVLRRRRSHVLDRATLCIRPGEVVSLLGANGAGKSTFLSILAGELEADEARDGHAGVMLNGSALAALSAALQARTRSVLPQKPALSFDLDVGEVVAMGAYPFPGLSASEVDAAVRAALQRAGIEHLGSRRYLELSGGEQQRVQFARVLLQVLAQRRADPRGRYMLLDEPTASLDPLHQRTLLETLRQLAREEGVGILVIIHDVNLAALWSDRIALLVNGRILACDAPARVLTQENLDAVYGVDVHVMAHPLHPDKPLVVFG
ncbi:MAG: heme ABC transporter ATP-binding protein [Alcaligenaceae bacterium]|nr:heme ABC transporter ATP-binding protein [Alcaligenaceae bacterium]